MLTEQLKQNAKVVPLNPQEERLLRLFRRMDAQAQADMLLFMARLAKDHQTPST